MKKAKLYIIFILLFLVGCGSQTKKEETKLTDIHIPISQENYSLDPITADKTVEKNIIAQLFDTITYINPSKNSASNLISKSYSHNDDFTDWNFEIRDDLKFSNGEKISLDSIVASLKRTDLEKLYKNLKISIQNNAVNFHSDEPIYYLDEKLANPKYAITYPNTDFNDITKIVTSGAFNIEYKNDDELKIVKNTNYWDNQNNSINSVTFTYQKDPELAYQMTTQDLYDIFATNFYNIPKQKLKAIGSEPNTLSFPGNDVHFLFLNKNGNIKNENLRRSLIYSLERETIISTNLMGKEKTATSIFSDNSFKDYDLEKSREEFNKSGYVPSKDANLTMIVRDGYNVRDLSTLILTNWYKLYKIPINIKILTDSSFYEYVANNNYDIALDYYSSSEIKQYDLFDYLKTIYPTDIKLDKSNLDKYIATLENSEKTLIDNGEFSPIYTNSYFMQINPKIKFISTNIYGITYIRDIK